MLLSILSTGSALLTLTSSLRDAEAINIAGSLRMQSYRLGYDLQSRSPQINAHRQLFQHALNSPVLQNLSTVCAAGGENSLRAPARQLAGDE